MQKADLVVHDGTQAHDAHMDVVFLADQSGVFQSSPARQSVVAKKEIQEKEFSGNRRVFYWNECLVCEFLNTNKCERMNNKTDAIWDGASTSFS